MKKILSSITVVAFLLGISTSHAAERGFCKVTGQEGFNERIYHKIDEDQCYDNSPGNHFLIGVLAGGAIVGGAWIAVYLLNRESGNPNLQVKVGEVDFESGAKFYYKPDINFADNLEIGWKTGLHW